GVGAWVVDDPSPLRARYKPDASPADGVGPAALGVPVADRVATTRDAQSGIGDEPYHDDRAVISETLPDRAVGTGPLDDQAPLDGCPRRGERFDLGPP